MPPHQLTDDFSDLLPSIMLDCEEASGLIVERCLFDAIIDFCQISHYWQETVGAITVIENVSTYDISTTNLTEILSVTRVYFDGEELSRRNWQQLSQGSIRLNLNPGDTVDAVVALKPKKVDGVFTFSKSILSDYRDAFIAGAKSRLFVIPRKEWTDLNLAQFNFQIFRDAAEAARLRQADGFSRLPQHISKPREFF